MQQWTETHFTQYGLLSNDSICYVLKVYSDQSWIKFIYHRVLVIKSFILQEALCISNTLRMIRLKIMMWRWPQWMQTTDNVVQTNTKRLIVQTGVQLSSSTKIARANFLTSVKRRNTDRAIVWKYWKIVGHTSIVIFLLIYYIYAYFKHYSRT